MRVLVTGGAGYIGSHTLKALLARGHEVVAVDDLRTGWRAPLVLLGVPLVEADVADRTRLAKLLAGERIDAVLHFAASCYVGESVEQPAAYYENNLVGTLRLGEACLDAGVRIVVLSSSAAVYGQPDVSPIPEETPRQPLNPYGRSKQMAEDVLTDLAAGGRLAPIFLRYFNAAGADPDGVLGEDHAPETHLIPNALLAALGRRPALEIFGDDYPTRDGSCVRDFVHVSDLADAHVRALDFAAAGGACRAFNLGNGEGFTVREVAEAARRVSGRDFPIHVQPRRPGDPATLVASSQRARRELSWTPAHPDLEAIVRTAWNWQCAHPEGYGERGRTVS